MGETTSISQPTRVSARSPMTAVLGATAAAIAIWAVATAAGAELIVTVGSGQPMKITLVNVVLSALLGSVTGVALFGLLRRFTPRARRVWTVTAVVAALLSLAGPLSATASTGTKVSLVAMHVVVATVLIVLLRRPATPRTG